MTCLASGTQHLQHDLLYVLAGSSSSSSSRISSSTHLGSANTLVPVGSAGAGSAVNAPKLLAGGNAVLAGAGAAAGSSMTLGRGTYPV